MERYETKFSLKEICDILEIELPEEHKHLADFVFTNVSYSENFLREDGAFFINAKTNEDIDRKINKAISEKIKFVFINSKYSNNPLLKNIPHIAIEKPFHSVIKLSASIRGKLGVKVVGITGSLGKTTTKDIVFSVLSYDNKAMKSRGNQNTIFPIFENLQKMPEDNEFFVQEFGAASPNIMPKTVEACIPDVGIITNISDPHLDVFGTKERILKEKVRMIRRMPAGCPAFLNYDDPLLKKVKLKDYPIISFAINNKEADYYAENINEIDEQITFDVVTKEKRVNVMLPARGIHNVGNAVVAFAIGEWFGLSEDTIVKGLASYMSEGIRQNITNIGGYNLFIDCYNTAPVSLVNDIKILDQLPVAKGGIRVAVLGDIVRLGDQAEALHIQTAKEIGKSNLDIAYCFGNELAELMANELKKQGIEAHYTDDRNELNDWIKETVSRKDVVLFKGPVARLLSKTIDQVYGTSLHIVSEHFEWLNEDDYRVKVIFEKGHRERNLAALIKYNGSEKEPKFLRSVNESAVFSVGPECFKENGTIEKADIPEPILNIAAGAFRDCGALKEVKLPKSLKTIEKNAFMDCEALSDIVFPEGLIEIGDRAFMGCKSLKKVILPTTVGHVGEDAFPDTCVVVYPELAKEKESMKEKVRRSSRRRKKKARQHINKVADRTKKFLRVVKRKTS